MTSGGVLVRASKAAIARSLKLGMFCPIDHPTARAINSVL
jgi:hypothetical protein